MAFPTLWRSDAPTTWSDLYATRREIDRVFDQVFGGKAGTVSGTWMPVVDVRETKETIDVVAELPGLRSDDVEVNVENNILTISGEKKQELTESGDGAEYHLIERRCGRFERSFTLPRTVDAEKISAKFEHGLLTISLPKAEAAKPRRVEIRTK